MSEHRSNDEFWQRDPEGRRPPRPDRRWLIGALVLVAVLVVVGVLLSGRGGGSDDDGGPATRPVGQSVMVFADPQCGCCEDWSAYLREHGFQVETELVEDMDEVKAVKGVPVDGEGCHTAVVGDYVVEGHVPVEAIDRLLTERPDIEGITLPGMPAGSPGMGGEKSAPFDVMSIDDGALGPFMAV